ncbi:hypothetical protein [Mucilaginibacter agri]|uniref:Uncharacterized protein n=1 Tax=Mucilaginibacter agri TaxID=2695265 RepID=A0A966DTS9_9SPHI|nr:hypothetical protein [Mucilaginibacter agri]NCD69667.1 hypothetical protein [Mucilaginibacter agri]
MKYIALFCIASLSIISCSSPDNKQSATDTVVAGDTLAKSATTEKTNDTPTTSSLCFLRTEGKNNKDSTSIELVIKGSEVTGQMNWLPYQKDSRKGTLKGTKTGDIIAAQWSFMQEGMQDTLNLKFKLQDTLLMQKPLKLNTKTGREETDDSKDYSVSYQSSNKLHH